MKLVVIGLGYSAGFFARAAMAAGWEVTGTVRSADKAARLSGEGIPSLVFAGFAVSRALEKAVSEADALLISAPPGDEGDPALSALGGIIAAAPPLRWIGYLSTIGVYGDHGGAWIDESAPCHAGNARTRLRVATEDAWLALGETAGKAVQIFRLSGIYGPGRNAITKLRNGIANRLIKPGQVFNRIHVDDIAGALLASIGKPHPGAIYNLTDDEPAPPQDVITYAAELTGLTQPPETPFDAATLSPMAASFYSQNKRVSNSFIKRDLGYVFRHPDYRQALRVLAAAGE